MTNSKKVATFRLRSRIEDFNVDNAGNLVHSEAVRRFLTQELWPSPEERPWTPEEVEFINEECSHFVFVAANDIWINPHCSASHHTMLAGNIARLKVPVVVFGLGTQTTYQPPGEVNIAPETLYFLKVLSEHSASIGVRGAFTAQILADLGLANVTVTGCQSAFWPMQAFFETRLAEPCAARIAFNFTGFLMDMPLIRLAMTLSWDLIGQQHPAERQIASGMPTPEFPPRYLEAFKQGWLAPDAFKRWVKGHFYIFNEIETWFEHMRQYTFAVGTRFHGNMIALLSGVPALWIAHDMRTRELCEHLKLPSLWLRDANRFEKLEDFLHAVDYTPFRQAYPENYRILYDFIQSSGLEHRLALPQTNPNRP